MTEALDLHAHAHTRSHAEHAPTGAASTRQAGLPAAVITCSDSAARRGAPDESGRLAIEALRALGHQAESEVVVVPDDVEAIRDAVRTAIAAGNRIVVTTGGTGAGPRDVTPEAIRSLGLRELPGLGEAIRAASREQVPTADLSRTFGGILGGTVVLALPGSPGGVRDGLAAVGALLGHAVDMAAGGGHPGPRRAQVRVAETTRQDRIHETTGQGPVQESTPQQVHETTRHEPVHKATRHEQVDETRQLPRPGGTELVRVSSISVDDVAAAVDGPQVGAVVTFVGTVRDHDRGRSVVRLEYEAHPEASHVLDKLLTQARAQPGVLGAAALHREGELAVGEVAFVAAIGAAHRSEAFAACAWLVDEVKARLPVWKHQHFADGTDEWVNCA